MKNQLLTAFDRLKYEFIKSDDQEEMLRIADILVEGSPVIVNFEKVDAKTCNFILAFLSGVVYALNGEAIKITDTLFMFGSEADFADGSLKQYVEDVK